MSESSERRQLVITLALLFAFLLLGLVGFWTVAIPELMETPQGAEADGGAPRPIEE